MTDPDPRDIVRSLSWKEAPGERGLNCLDDETIGMLADGSLDAEARSRATAHLSECAHCRQSLASLVRALDDRAVVAAIGSRAAQRRRLIRLAVPAVAAAGLLITVMARNERVDGPPPPLPPPPAHRAPEATTADQPVAITPLGTVARPEILRWTTVAGADRYRVTLYQAGGRVLYEWELTDTATALPDSLPLNPGERYLWKVEARTGWGRWSSSRLFEFSVARSPAR